MSAYQGRCHPIERFLCCQIWTSIQACISCSPIWPAIKSAAEIFQLKLQFTTIRYVSWVNKVKPERKIVEHSLQDEGHSHIFTISSKTFDLLFHEVSSGNASETSSNPYRAVGVRVTDECERTNFMSSQGENDISDADSVRVNCTSCVNFSYKLRTT